MGTPITVTANIEDYKVFISDLTQTLGHSQFSTRYNRNNTKAYARDMSDFIKIKEELINTNVESTLELEMKTGPRSWF